MEFDGNDIITTEELDSPSESSLNNEIGQWIQDNICWIHPMAILLFALGFWSLFCRPRRLVEASEPVASRTRARTQEQNQAEEEEEEEEQVHGFMFLWLSAIQRAVKNRFR